VHAIGVSTLAAGHKTLVPAMVKALREQGANDIVIFVGGVIPARTTISAVQGRRVPGIFGPGTPIPQCAHEVLRAIRAADLPERLRG
jgi:methylmalonyl-CoA mutase